VDIQDFDPEDIDIKVEAGYIVMKGRREVVRGNSTSVREKGFLDVLLADLIPSLVIF
jgi:hypothetical protein